MTGLDVLVQARMGSTRLPRKVLAEVRPGRHLIDAVLERVRRSRAGSRGRLVVLTTASDKDLPLVEHLERAGEEVFRGSEEDVFGRFHECLLASSRRSRWFFRVCADNPFLEPSFMDEMASLAEELRDGADYISYAARDGTPAIRTHFGVFTELVRTDAFLDAAEWVRGGEQREHVTPVFYQDARLSARYLPIPPDLEQSGVRLTIDTAEDLRTAQELLALLPVGFGFRDVLAQVDSRPALRQRMRAEILRNAK